MKKVTLFAVAAMAVLSLASCKKNHTCTCTSGSYTSVTTAKSSKKGGAAWCSGMNSVSYTSDYTTPSGTTTSTGTATQSCTFA